MQASRLAIVAALSAFAFAAHADEADASQYVNQFQGQQTRAEVQAQLGQYKKAGVNPWSTSYNQLAGFRGERSRAQVQAEFVASRDRVAAFTGEDSGSAYLTASKASPAGRQLAGTPVNAQ